MPEPRRDIPCPVQRALERAGHIGEVVPLGAFADLAVKALGAQGPAAQKLHRAIFAIGAVANGLRSLPRNLREGFRPHELRGGPLDKRGGGTRIYSQSGQFDAAEFARFETFARPYPAPDGAGTEQGWGAPELKAYMDANQARSGGGWVQRHVLMEGELPKLLELMGQGPGASLHLTVPEVLALYRDERLPERVEARLAAKG